MADVTFPQVPGVNFACRGARAARIANIAAFVLQARGIQSFVVVGDNNVLTLDEAVWNTPIGTYRCVIVGKETFNLLPAHSQQAILFPPRPAESDYWGVVGASQQDDITRMTELLSYIKEPAASGNAGKVFEQCWPAIIKAEAAAGGGPVG